jgi:putative FmdB family regulatory protein
MPIYEYLCEECGTRHERVVLSRSQTIACPKCASERQTLQLSVFRAMSKSASANGSSSSAAGCGCTPKTCGCH